MFCLFVYWIDPNEVFFASMRQSDKVYHHTCIDITVNLDYVWRSTQIDENFSASVGQIEKVYIDEF